MKITTRIITSALAAVMLVSGGALPAAAEGVAPVRESMAFSAVGGLATPKFTNVSKGRTHIRLTWKKVKGASGYKIYRKYQGRYELIETVKGGGVTSVRLGGFESRTRYSFKIRAYKKSGGRTTFSQYSPAKIVTTKFGKVTDEFRSSVFSLKYEPDKWEVHELYPDDDSPGAKKIDCEYIRSGKDDDDCLYNAETIISAVKLKKKDKNKSLKYFVKKICGEEAHYHVYYDVDYGRISGAKCAFLTEMDKEDDYPDVVIIVRDGYFYRYTISILEGFKDADDWYDQIFCLLNDVKLGSE